MLQQDRRQIAVSPLKTTNPLMESVSVPPFRSKEGEIYLYDASSKFGKHVPSCSTIGTEIKGGE